MAQILKAGERILIVDRRGSLVGLPALLERSPGKPVPMGCIDSTVPPFLDGKKRTSEQMAATRLLNEELKKPVVGDPKGVLPDLSIFRR